MFRDFKLQNKILIPIGSLVFIVFAITISFVSYSSNNLARTQAHNLVEQVAFRHGTSIKAEIEVAMNATRTLALGLEGLLAQGNAPDAEEVTEMLRTVLDGNKEFITIFVVYEPDILNEDNAEHTATASPNSKTRVAHAWLRNTTGQLIFQKVNGIEQKDYYIRSKQLGKECITEPYVFNIQGKKTRTTTLVVPFMQQGRFAGVVGVDISLENLNNAISNIHPYETGYAFITSNNGCILAHPNKGMLSRSIKEVGRVDENEAIKQGKVHSTIRTSTIDNKERLYIYTPISIGRTDTPMSFGIAVEMDKVMAAPRAIMLKVCIIALAALVLLILSVFIISKAICRPVEQTITYAKKVAEGDFRQHLDIKQKDELGILADALRQMVAELKHRLGFAQGVLNGFTMPCAVIDTDQNISFINNAAIELLGLDGNADSHMGQNAQKLFRNNQECLTIISGTLRNMKPCTQIKIDMIRPDSTVAHTLVDCAPLKDIDGEAIGIFTVFADVTALTRQQLLITEQNKRIAQTAHNADDISHKVSSAASDLSVQIEQALQGTEEQRARTSEVATAVEEMNASILEVARNTGDAAQGSDNMRQNALHGDQVVQNVVLSISDIQNQSQVMAESLNELGVQVEGINVIMSVINDIADQTNLLALNAAIEAARAGDAGRGFAVVADEVRKLAEKTMGATKEVGDAINSIQTHTAKSIRSMDTTNVAISKTTALTEEAGEALKQIFAQVDDSADKIRAIATASEEQSSASEEINKGAGHVNQIALETADAMRQSAVAVTDLACQAQNLKDIIQEMAAE